MCFLIFPGKRNGVVNHLYKNLLDNLPKEIEMLSLVFKDSESLSDSGFKLIVKGLARHKEYLKDLSVTTHGASTSKLTKAHIFMMINILKKMKKLRRIWFFHELFPC